MTPLPAEALLPGTTLAFQVWDAVGWLGQALFTARMLQQWIRSERAGRSHVTASFWWLSLAGTVALLVYQVHRRDPVFLAGLMVNGAIYVRNLMLLRGEQRVRPRRESPLVSVTLGLFAFAGVAVLLFRAGTKVGRFAFEPWLLAWGFAVQAIWSSRFVLQWWVSERGGRSVLPPSFFYASIVGALGLL
ncbi:MAG: lipid-A-disaccharide synthase N-terminal domain-containing protein, partial [Planctomycetota bacterium]